MSLRLVEPQKNSSFFAGIIVLLIGIPMCGILFGFFIAFIRLGYHALWTLFIS